MKFEHAYESQVWAAVYAAEWRKNMDELPVPMRDDRVMGVVRHAARLADCAVELYREYKLDGGKHGPA